MKNPRNAFLCFTVLWLSLCSIITAADAQTVEEIAEIALAATVYLEMTDRNGESAGFGSGFFVAQDQVATNFHVFEGAAKGTAKQVGKYTKYTIEGISTTDKENDLAILKVTAFGIEPLPLGDSETVKIGETVYVAGNPRGLEGTFSDGIISSLRERYTRKRIQMTAPISPGSSGDPVLNGKGEVIGVSFMTIEGGQNLNFAIPSIYLKALLEQSVPAKPFSQDNEFISAETCFSRGCASYMLGDYSDANANYTQAIRLKPNYAGAYYGRANAKYNLGERIAAIVDYNAAIRLKPDLVQAYYNRGRAKALLGHTWGAKQDFRNALQFANRFGDESLIAKIEEVFKLIE